jgi:hypothetical protein
VDFPHYRVDDTPIHSGIPACQWWFEGLLPQSPSWRLVHGCCHTLVS